MMIKECGQLTWHRHMHMEWAKILIFKKEKIWHINIKKQYKNV